MGELIPEDARNKLEDLYGIVLKPGQNPYAAFIEACNDESKEIQALYSAHRIKRNAQQRDKFLSPDFRELLIDQHLLRLENPRIQPDFRDERHCFVIWARPPNHVLRLAARVQDMLKVAAPDVWLMPPYRMHMTTLEVAFSKTPEEIQSLVSTLRPSIPSIASYTYSHRARLVKPMISYDLSAFALSFIPASGEAAVSPESGDEHAKITQTDGYTYHHLRRDVFDQVKASGLEVGSRYQVPSAHITLGRYLAPSDHDTAEKRERWVRAIEEVNEWLEKEVWDGDQEDSEFVGEWIVGQERGLDVRAGTLWYGIGRTILMGEGF